MSALTTKRRWVPSGISVGSYQVWVDSSKIAEANPVVRDESIQKTISQGNPIGKVRKNAKYKRLYFSLFGHFPGGSEDVGGPFTTYKVSTKSYPDSGFGLIGGNPVSVHWTYKGRAAAYTALPNLSEGSYLPPSSDAVLDGYGTTAIARCIPTNPLAGMGQFLGELHDLPRIPDIGAWRSRALGFRKSTRGFNFGASSRAAADEYLNLVFGWLPFVSDLQKFFKTAADSAAQVKKFAAGSNHLIHRSYTFPDETTTTVEVVSQNAYPDPPLNVYLWTSPGVLTKTTTTTTKRWFKGAFTYYLPGPSADDSKLARWIKLAKLTEQLAHRLYGLRLDPDLLWKLAPWSWAIDWVSNTGDIIHNWSAFANDGLVMNYGYLMEHKIQRVEYSLVGVSCSAGRPNFSQVYLYETKTRRKATPYGFGVNPASFTAKQWSIIAALGISKIPRSLS